MSTNEVRHGSTSKAGNSGVFFGLAAIALAVIIAGAFVLAAKQRSENTDTGTEIELSRPALQAESQRLESLADHWIALPGN